MIPTLPLRLRNRLAETILSALHDPSARSQLRRLGMAVRGEPRSGGDPSPSMTEIVRGEPPGGDPSPSMTEIVRGEPPGGEPSEHASLLRARARAAAEALAGCPVWSAEPSLDEALAAAATLFDAGLHFEVHELLEPYWTRAEGLERQALQGLIQIAVGYQHLANGNLRGAHALLSEGSDRLRDGRLTGLDLAGFADAVTATIPRLAEPAAPAVPPFPRKAVVQR